MSIYDNIAYGPRLHGTHSKAELNDLVEKSLRGAAAVGRGEGPFEKSRPWAFPAASSSACASRARWLWSRTCC